MPPSPSLSAVFVALLALSAATLFTLSAAPPLRGQTTINIDFGPSEERVVYGGVGPSGGNPIQVWNQVESSKVRLLDAAGNATTIGVTVADQKGVTDAGYYTSEPLSELLRDYIYDNDDGSFTVTISGLEPGTTFDLYWIGVGGPFAGFGAAVTISGELTGEASNEPLNGSTWVERQNYVFYRGLKADERGTLVATLTSNSLKKEADLAGLQIVFPSVPRKPLVEPSGESKPPTAR